MYVLRLHVLRLLFVVLLGYHCKFLLKPKGKIRKPKQKPQNKNQNQNTIFIGTCIGDSSEKDVIQMYITTSTYIVRLR